MLSVDDALAHILSTCQPLATERVWLQAALGRVLAEPVRAVRDLPPMDNSAMDGWAVRHADLRDDVALRVGETIPAGGRACRPLEAGEAARIFTGAPVPDGADTIVMQERATRDEASGTVRFEGWGPTGEHVRRRGSDIAAGEVLVPAGTPLLPTHLGLLAGQGQSRIAVCRRPVVAILATGDEVHEPGETLPEGHIYSSNHHLLAAMVEAAGGVPRLLGIARDDREQIRHRLEDARGADVLLTIGGVSVGEFDFVKEALSALGASQDFWKVAMRPGKPNVFGEIRGARYFGLPGNAVSCAVSFLVFVLPALRALLGHPHPVPEPTIATTTNWLPGKRGLRHFHRAILKPSAAGRPTVSLAGDQGSGRSCSLTLANCLVVVGEGEDFVPEGAAVPVLTFPGLLSP
jgi:molybdopterin molybdotransferase